MELELKQTSMPYLKCIVQEIKNQEETGETIVPDSYPDIGSVVHAYADAIIRGKDCRNGSITVSGGCKGGIIYDPEDHSAPKTLEFYFPFTMKTEHPGLSEQSKSICEIKVRSVDGRMINSRKAMLRVDLGCSIRAFEETQENFFSLSDKPDTLQTLEQTYTLCLPVAVSEKSFVVSDTLDIPMSKAPLSSICKFICQAQISEKKLVGNKGVFKGTVSCKLLYSSDDLNFYVHEQQIPFSQYCEFDHDHSDEQLDVIPVITGYHIEPEGHEEIRQALVTVHILVQGCVHANRMITITEDAYSTQELFTPQWTEHHITSVLDRRSDHMSTHHQLKGSLNEIIDCDMYLGHPMIHRTKDEIHIDAPVAVQIFGLNEEGQPSCITGKVEASQTLALSENAHCIANVVALGPCYPSLKQDGVDVRCELVCDSEFYAEQALKSLSAGETEPVPEREVDSASVILKKVRKGTKLWDIAKAHNSREDVIISANRLTDHSLQEDRVLLIPVG